MVRARPPRPAGSPSPFHASGRACRVPTGATARPSPGPGPSGRSPGVYHNEDVRAVLAGQRARDVVPRDGACDPWARTGGSDVEPDGAHQGQGVALAHDAGPHAIVEGE